MGKSKDNEQKENVEDIKLEQLLAEIEQGKIPLQYILENLLDLLVRLSEKERQLDDLLKSFPQLSDISRKIGEIHTLHFPAKELKKKTQRDRFMAQILLGPVRKM